MHNFGERTLIIFILIMNIIFVIITGMNFYYFNQMQKAEHSAVSPSTANSIKILNGVIFIFELILFLFIFYILYQQTQDQTKIQELDDKNDKIKLKKEAINDVQRNFKHNAEKSLKDFSENVKPKFDQLNYQLSSANEKMEEINREIAMKDAIIQSQNEKLSQLEEDEDINELIDDFNTELDERKPLVGTNQSGRPKFFDWNK